MSRAQFKAAQNVGHDLGHELSSALASMFGINRLADTVKADAN